LISGAWKLGKQLAKRIAPEMTGLPTNKGKLDHDSSTTADPALPCKRRWLIGIGSFFQRVLQHLIFWAPAHIAAASFVRHFARTRLRRKDTT